MGGLASVVVAVAVLVHLPHLVGTTWRDVGDAAATLAPATLVGLTVVWAAGLATYTAVLTGSLPGLTHRRALLLNLSGSAVSSALPLGGAFGIWMNTAMFRVWGFRARQIADFTVTSNVVDVAGKLVVSGGLLAVAVAAGSLPPGTSTTLETVACVVAVGLLAAAALTWTPGTRALTRAASRVAALAPRPGPSPGPAGSSPSPRERVAERQRTWEVALLSLRARVAHRLRAAWPSLTLGVTGYVALQGLLFALCLRVAAPPVALTVVAAAFAVDRLLSMVPLTPSGAGFAEAGAGAVLVAGGNDPAAVLAGVLLYRTFIVALEVPVGGFALAGWFLARRLARPPVPTTGAVHGGGSR